MINVVVTNESKEHECPVGYDGKYAVDNFVLFTQLGTMYPGMISSIDLLLSSLFNNILYYLENNEFYL